MKPYGIPRVLDVIIADCADMFNYALKPSKGNLPGKGGDIHNFIRNVKSKSAQRRYWKKKARTKNKRICREELKCVEY